MRSVAEIYAAHCRTSTAISPHLPRLRELAEGCEVAVEFGVKRGASSSALLMGAKTVVSYDVEPTKEARELEAVAGERWSYRIQDTRTADIPAPDFLFVDSLHTYAQVQAELEAHADKVRSVLVFHDVTTFGEVSAVGETGRQAWQYVPGGGSCPIQHIGIRPAIDALMIRDPSWRIAARYTDSHGLLVLRRV